MPAPLETAPNPSTDPYAPCMLCPRQCGADRRGLPGTGLRGSGEPGGTRPPAVAGGRSSAEPENAAPSWCGEGAELRLASASIHKGEEPPISGRGGSGTIFVTGCNLGCVFCQNYQISQGGMGRRVSLAEFAAIALALQREGAENINIVTGSHAVPAIAAGLDRAKEQGLHIPVLWNSSGYESETTLALLRERVDVYLPDLKTLDSQVASQFFYAPDYPEYAKAAILKMLSYQGTLRWNEDESILTKGVIIRHLIIPGYLESTREVIKWFSRHAQGKTSHSKALLSLMTQYVPTPIGTGQGAGKADIPQRCLIREEYDQVMDWLTEYEIEDGFYQEPVTGRDWLPDFTRPNPFSSRLSKPVWHWGMG